MSLGLTLRTAREAKGLTTSELATKTHMLVQIVEGLENEDFRRIPAPIYGRGFVKLYCETVGLEPKPLQDEFMELYTQYKNAPEKFHGLSARRTPPPPPAPEPEPVAPPPMETQPVAPPPPPVPEPEPVYVAPTPPPPPAPEPVPVPVAPPPIETQAVVPPPTPAPEPEPVYVAPTPPPPPAPEPVPELHAASAEPTQPEPEPAKLADAEPSTEAPPRRSYGDLFDQTYAAEEEPNKPSAVEMFHDTLSNISSGVFTNVKKVPTKTWRIAAVSVVGIILLVFMVWGVVILYRATTPQPDEAPAAKDGQQATAVKAAAASPAKPERQAMSNPAKKPTSTAKPAATPENAPTTKPNTATKSTKPVKAGDLKQSGIEIPSLYID